MKRQNIKIIFAAVAVAFCLFSKTSSATTQPLEVEDPGSGTWQCPEGNKYKCVEKGSFVIMKGEGGTPVQL